MLSLGNIQSKVFQKSSLVKADLQLHHGAASCELHSLLDEGRVSCGNSGVVEVSWIGGRLHDLVIVVVEDGLPTGSVVDDSFANPLLEVLEGEGEVGGAHQTFVVLQEGFLEDSPVVDVETV